MRPPDDVHEGLIVSVGRNAVWVALDGEQHLRLGALRKHGDQSGLVPGDRVRAQRLDDDRAIVDARLPRRFGLVRTTSGGRQKTMAANVDTMAIVAAFTRPAIDLAMLDELLAFAEHQRLQSLIVLTKPDLAGPNELVETPALYRGLGYATLVVNPKTGEGVAELAAALDRRHSLLIGQSGVGKSSLFRTLGGEAVVGELSKGGSGRQTTTSSRLLRLIDGFLIDSPGVGQFRLDGLSQSELAWAYREIRPLVTECRFTDCTHTVEPGCAVGLAAAAGTIAPSRFASYRGIHGRDDGDG
jgi:ribosome biogenesis GTPase